MANSTQIITDLTTTINNGPTAATQALAIAAGGPTMDYVGNLNLLLTKAQEMNQLLTLVLTDTDAADPNKATLTSILNDLS